MVPGSFHIRAGTPETIFLPGISLIEMVPDLARRASEQCRTILFLGKDPGAMALRSSQSQEGMPETIFLLGISLNEMVPGSSSMVS